MKKKISKEERQKRIREHMEFSGASEADARFMVAIELGEIPGDVLTVDDSKTPGPRKEPE